MITRRQPLALKCFSSFDVPQPIGTHFGVVPAVVLNDELEFGIAQIESLRPVAVHFTEDVVDSWLRQSAQYD
jgi:hypothetical protein